MAMAPKQIPCIEAPRSMQRFDDVREKTPAPASSARDFFDDGSVPHRELPCMLQE
jgi:hypothetical protein